MTLLHNLPNASNNPIEALLIDDVAPLRCILTMNTKYAAFTAGANGSIEIWRDITTGAFRAQVKVHNIVRATINTASLTGLEEFVKDQIEKVR